MFAVEVQMAEHTGLETLDAACNPALPEYLENAGGYRAMMMDLEVNAEPEGRAPAFYELLTTLCDPPFVGRYDVFRDSAPKVCVLSGAPAFGFGVWITPCSDGLATMRRHPSPSSTVDEVLQCDAPGWIFCLPISD